MAHVRRMNSIFTDHGLFTNLNTDFADLPCRTGAVLFESSLLMSEMACTRCDFTFLQRSFLRDIKREYSNQEVLALVEHVTGRQLTLSDQKTTNRIHDTLHWVADTTLSTEKPGFTPFLSLEEGLKNTWNWFRQYHGDCY